MRLCSILRVQFRSCLGRSAAQNKSNALQMNGVCFGQRRRRVKRNADLCGEFRIVQKRNGAVRGEILGDRQCVICEINQKQSVQNRSGSGKMVTSTTDTEQRQSKKPANILRAREENMLSSSHALPNTWNHANIAQNMESYKTITRHS